jgi:hypothetical protein
MIVSLYSAIVVSVYLDQFHSGFIDASQDHFIFRKRKDPGGERNHKKVQ